MESKHPKHPNKSKTINFCLLAIIIILTASLFVALQSAKAVGPISIIVIGSDGVSHPINDITTLTPTIGWGGYRTPSGAINSGYFQGVSLLDLCNSIGTTLTNNQNVTVQTSGGPSSIIFNYDQVVSGINIAPQYGTFNNVTGATQAPSAGNPVTLIVAYENANGTALPGSGTITRLMIVGPEGLLFQGQGLAGVTNITITNNTPVSTPTPSPSPTPTSTPSPTATLTVSPTPSPSPVPSPTQSPTQSPTPTISPSPTSSPTSSPEPAGPSMALETNVVIGVIIIILVIVIIIFLITRRKKT